MKEKLLQLSEKFQNLIKLFSFNYIQEFITLVYSEIKPQKNYRILKIFMYTVV
jgi:hypothetical protein